MRVVLGVSDQVESTQVLKALLALDWDDLRVFPTHVLEHVGSSFGKFMLTATEAEYYSEYMHAERLKTKELMDIFDQNLLAQGVKGSSCVKEGHVANELMTRVKEIDADLLTVGLKGPETFNHFLFGTVGRKLIFQCPTSLFIYKAPTSLNTLNRAVFATDHSSYANSALDRLLRFRPKGLERITVMTAYPKELASALGSVVSQLNVDVNQWIEEKLTQENQKVIEKLRQAGFEAESEVRGQEVHEAIHGTMQHVGAGLLILGAQGHGMLEGIGVGSVTAHQVLHTPHSVLVLRPLP